MMLIHILATLEKWLRYCLNFQFVSLSMYMYVVGHCTCRFLGHQGLSVFKCSERFLFSSSLKDMENKMRNTLNEIYFGKTKDIVNSLR